MSRQPDNQWPAVKRASSDDLRRCPPVEMIPSNCFLPVSNPLLENVE